MGIIEYADRAVPVQGLVGFVDAEVVKTYSREQLTELAKQYCIDGYGLPKDSEDKDRWHERFGLLCSFIFDLFPANAPRQALPSGSRLEADVGPSGKGPQ